MKKIELLAPGGDVDSIKAAIVAGADAVYCGLNKFNARNRATNISFVELQGVIRLAHQYHCEVFLTLNILILESEIPDLFRLLNKLVNTNIDGVIVQDVGMLYLLSKYFQTLKIHASTQLTTHNKGQIKFLKKLSSRRVNLSRELSIHEIKDLTKVAHQNGVLIEVFVHGSYCISFSGICYMSSVHGGNSGNRGRCSQPCRDAYETTPEGNNYPLNLKDNSAFFDLKDLSEAGVDSLKIEGRIKGFEYVYTVVDAWKKQIQGYSDNDIVNQDNSALYKVFNRDFSNAYLKGDIDKDMFIDNPMTHSSEYYSKIEKAESRTHIRREIDSLSIEKIPVVISVSGEFASPLKVSVKTPDTEFEVISDAILANEGREVLSHKMIIQRLKAINDTEYFIEHLDMSSLGANLYFPFKELTVIKKRLLFILNGSKEYIAPVKIPLINRSEKAVSGQSLSVLISSAEDLYICKEADVDVYFQLPDGFKSQATELLNLFSKNKDLIPWFPSVLIGEDYQAALDFLLKLKPKLIVTNNSGIGYDAYKREILWIAGPYLNTVNSFSLKNLQESFNCAGAFISNELSEYQIKTIKKPDDFRLYYSIYHPIVLMTSRQCFFHQVTGCEKDRIDGTCIQNCEKSASITDLKSNSFLIEKTRGNYHRIYNQLNFLNTDIVKDIPNTFSSFLIDLGEVRTETKMDTDKLELIKLFKHILAGDDDSQKELRQILHSTTDSQYRVGI